MTNDKKTVSMSTVKPKKESRSVLGRWWLVFGSCHVDDTACETKEEADLGFNESCHEAIVEVIAVTEHDRIVADYESRLTKMSRFNNDALDGQEKLEAELAGVKAELAAKTHQLKLLYAEEDRELFKALDEIAELKKELATARAQIEKLREQRNDAFRVVDTRENIARYIEEDDAEVAALNDKESKSP